MTVVRRGRRAGGGRELANLVADSIRRRLIPDIEVVPWRNLNVLAVQVHPSNTRPHYLDAGLEDGVFIRVGSTNRKAEALQIEELKRLTGEPRSTSRRFRT